MACPTCDHTMHSLVAALLWYCPRCGTVKDALNRVTTPAIVDRVKEVLGEGALGPNEVTLLRECVFEVSESDT